MSNTVFFSGRVAYGGKSKLDGDCGTWAFITLPTTMLMIDRWCILWQQRWTFWMSAKKTTINRSANCYGQVLTISPENSDTSGFHFIERPSLARQVFGIYRLSPVLLAYKMGPWRLNKSTAHPLLSIECALFRHHQSDRLTGLWQKINGGNEHGDNILYSAPLN